MIPEEKKKIFLITTIQNNCAERRTKKEKRKEKSFQLELNEYPVIRFMKMIQCGTMFGYRIEKSIRRRPFLPSKKASSLS